MKKYYYFFGIIAALIVFRIAANASSALNLNTIKACKIVDLQQQQIISGSKESVSTNYRYLIITDKGTFISESSLLNGKYDNSEVFFGLKKDSIYDLKVSGYGKSFFFDYRNILSYKKL